MFDIGKWVSKLIFTPSSYKQLRDFVLDAEAFTEYGKKIVLMRPNEDGELIQTNEPFLQKIAKANAKQEIDEALDHYSMQMIVTVATYIEAMITDFFQNLFIRNPEYMHDYITDENAKVGKGYIKINEVIACNDIDDFKYNLAMRATKNAVNGSMDAIAKRIHKLTNYQIDRELIKNIQDILNERHSIVHEANELTISPKNINNSFLVTENFLKELGKACKKKNLPYNDPAYWIDKYPTEV